MSITLLRFCLTSKAATLIVHKNPPQKSNPFIKEKEESLSFKYHINKTHAKVAASLAMLRRSKNYLPPKVKSLIYNALIKSHLEYCISVWGAAQTSFMKKLETAQKSAIRIVSSATYNSHTDPIFASLGQLKLAHIYEVSCAKIAKIIADKTAPAGLLETYRLQDPKSHETRSASEIYIHIPTPRTEQMKRLPTYKIPQIYSSLPCAMYGRENMLLLYTTEKFYEYSRFECAKPITCRSCQEQQNRRNQAARNLARNLANNLAAINSQVQGTPPTAPSNT